MQKLTTPQALLVAGAALTVTVAGLGIAYVRTVKANITREAAEIVEHLKANNAAASFEEEL